MVKNNLRMRKFNKIMCAALATMCVIGITASNVYAGTKTKSWTSSDNKTLYTATTTTTKTTAKTIVLGNWSKHVKDRDSVAATLTKSKTQSCEVSSQFEGSYGTELAKISASLGVSVTNSISHTFSKSLTVLGSARTGYYRPIIVFPRYTVHGKVVSSSNTNGNGDYLRKPPVKKTVYEKTIQYAPSKKDAYDDWDYKPL